LTRPASTRRDLERASTINVATDTPARIKLVALPPNTTVQLDGQAAGPTVAVPVGRHTITLTTT
jgi:hypothetical protein